MRAITISALAFALAPTLAAQLPTVVVPRQFTQAEGPTTSTYPLSYTQCRWQMIISGSEICANAATIFSMEFRLDAKEAPGVLPAKQLMPAIEFYMTGKTPLTMDKVWANNIGTATKTNVYATKTLNIPQVTASYPAPLPFSIKIPLDKPYSYAPASGDLLIDWVDTQTYVYSSWPADAAIYWQTGRPANTKIWEDKNCQDAAGNQAYISVDSSGGTIGTALGLTLKTAPATGYNLDVFVSWIGASNTQYGPLTLPFDVTGFAGMTGCMLATDILLVQATTTGTASWPIPLQQNLVGLPIYTQGCAIDSTKFALVLSYYAYVAYVAPAGGYSNAPVQHVYRTKYTNEVDGYISGNSFYGPILRFTGAFN